MPPRFSHHVFWKATFLYLRLVSVSTRHAIEHFEQRMTSSSHITRDCLCHRGEQHVVFLLFGKIRDIIMKTSNKEWLRALKLRAISFLVLWSLPQSNSHKKGNIVLRTCRAVQVCTIVLYCSLAFLACATEFLPSRVLVSNSLYSLLVWENTRHANEHFKQRMTSSSQSMRD